MHLKQTIMKQIIITLLIFLTFLGSCSKEKTRQRDNDTVIADSSSVADKKKAQKLTFALTGDMMLGTDFPETSNGAFLPVDSGRHLLKDCMDIFRNADVVAGNLEGVLGHGGTPKPCKNPSLCFTFRMPEYLSRCLVDAGFDYMNLANNHIGDFGQGGIEASMASLKKAGIAFGGVKKEAPYTIIEKNGLKVGFTGFSTHEFCPSVLDYDALTSILAEMRPKCDIIVVSMHAGGEGTSYMHVLRKEESFHNWPRGDVHKFAHMAIDNGADIVWGHGPHVLRGSEVYNDRLILYSLGNFCTPLKMGLAGATGQACLAEVTVDAEGKFLEGKLNSYIQQKGIGPRLDPDNASAKLIKRLSEEDFPESPLKISPEGRLSRN